MLAPAQPYYASPPAPRPPPSPASVSPTASGMSERVPTLARQLWEDGDGARRLSRRRPKHWTRCRCRGTAAKERPCRALRPSPPLGPGPFTSHVAVPVLAGQSGTAVPRGLVSDAESQAPLPPTEPEPVFIQGPGGSPHCEQTAGNAAEDVAEMARWRGRPGNPWPPRPAQSGRRPRPLPSGENALTGVRTRMFKQHRTRQPKGGRDPNAHRQPRGQAHGSTRRTEHSAVTDVLRAGPVSVTLAMKRQATDREEITAKHTQ